MPLGSLLILRQDENGQESVDRHPNLSLPESEQQLRAPLLERHPSQNENEPSDEAIETTGSDHLEQLSESNDELPPFRKLLFFRCMYFLDGLSSSVWGRFGVIFYNEVKHLSPEQIGTLQGVVPLLGFATTPFWGYSADLVKSRKAIFMLCTALSTASLMLLSLDAVDSFPLILICVAGMALFAGSGVLDAHALDFLGERHRSMYGTVRLWNAVGWGLGSVLIGGITDSTGFTWNFVLFGTMMTLKLLFTAFGLPARSKSEQARYNQSLTENLDGTSDTIQIQTNRTQQRPRWNILYRRLSSIPVLLWLVEVTAIASAASLIDSFLFVFLQNSLRASTKLCGLTVGASILLELPIFYYSEVLLKQWGHDVLFLVSMSAYIIRVVGYTCLTPASVNLVLLFEVLNGFNFACMWIASIDFAAAVAPEEWSTTVQTIHSMAVIGFGGGIGPIVGGYVMEHHGPIVMYRGAACLIGVVLIIHVVLWKVVRRGHVVFLSSLANILQDQPRQTSDASTSIGS